MHVSLDSALGRQRRLNSVGESVLQIAPSAAAAYSLRSLTGGDPDVVRVRRVIDNAESDFTASGVSSGALVDFVNQIQTVGTAVNGTGSFDNYTVSNLSTTGFSADNSAGGTGSAGFPYVFGDGDVIVARYTISNFSSTSGLSPQLRGVTSTASVSTVAGGATHHLANGTYTDTLTATASGSHLMFADSHTGSYTISDFEIVSHSSSGFVETWYDQSGNSKDAIQTTANLQPVIVAAGVFQNGLKFDSDGSSSGPDFRTPISSAQLSNDPAGNAGFALVWVGNVNQVQHADTQNHSVLGNIKGVATFSTGTIGLTVIPKTGTTKFISETGGSTTEIVEDTNALTPGDFGVVFFSYEDAELGVDPLLSVDGSTTTSGLSSLSSSSSNNIGIMTAITSGNAVQYSRSTDGICKEVLLYTGDQKSKRVALETNIAAEYGITLS